MSYRCKVCNAKVPHGQPLLRHVLYRQVKNQRQSYGVNDSKTRQEIAHEIPVCNSCKDSLDGGLPLDKLRILVAAESRWVQVKPKEPKRLVVGRSATDREIAKLQAQIATLEKK